MDSKLNIGCGINVIVGNGWINCDNSLLAKLKRSPLWFVVAWLIRRGILSEIYREYPDVRIVDIRRPLPFPDNSADYIYCSQVIEHLFFYDLSKFLSECSRVLKPNGVIRILTPDLNKIINLYQTRNLVRFEENDGLSSKYSADHLNLVFYPRSWVSRYKRTRLVRIMDAIPEQHKYVFDFETLSSLLLESGFKVVNEVATEASKFPEAGQLDKYQAISLQIEAKK